LLYSFDEGFDLYETLRAKGFLPPLIETPEEFSAAG